MSEIELTLETFEPLVGDEFALEGTERSFRLTATRDLDAKRLRWPDNMRPPFSLTFSTPDTEPLQQGNFTLAHETLGTITIFLVPSARENGELIFQATFS